MPTYVVTALEARLSGEQKAKLAREITRVHHEVTGGPSFFAQVIFNGVKPGDYFIGGSALEHDHIFVYGYIRAGRGGVEKHALITRIAEAVREASGIPITGIWVYIAELTPRQMIEFGHVLPDAGDEAKWTADLPEEARAFMQSIVTVASVRHQSSIGSL